jgi:signal transduction histidine kinase
VTEPQPGALPCRGLHGRGPGGRRAGRWSPGPGAGVRALSGVLLGAVQVVGSLAVVPLQPGRTVPDTPLAGALLLAGPVAFVLTRRPLARVVVATAAAATYLAIGYVIGPVLLTAILFLGLAAVAGRQLQAWLVGAAGLVGALTVSRLGPCPMPVAAVLPWVGWAVASFALADAVRARRESVRVWSRARDQIRLRQACEERVQVARDLLDEVAHRLRLLDARAAAALPPADDGDRGSPETVRETLPAVRDLGEQALAALRSVDDVLAVPGEAVPRPDAAGLDSLAELAGHWAGAGLLVRAAGDPGPLPSVVDQAAYRVVQEALANVARHSSAPHADIALYRDIDQLTIVVSDPGPPRVPCAEPAELDPDPDAWGAAGNGTTVVEVDGVTLVGCNGEIAEGRDGEAVIDCDSVRPEAGLPANRGLVRMRERVGALGGAVSAGPDGAGWCVYVVLPAGPDRPEGWLLAPLPGARDVTGGARSRA